MTTVLIGFNIRLETNLVTKSTRHKMTVNHNAPIELKPSSCAENALGFWPLNIAHETRELVSWPDAGKLLTVR